MGTSAAQILLRVLMTAALGLSVAVGVALGTPQPAADRARRAPAEATYLPEVERVTVEQARRLDRPLYVDVRRAERFGQHHIRGAISLPLEQLVEHPEQLPKERPLVLYCTCPMEHASAMGAALLRKKGYSEVYALQAVKGDWERL